MDGLATIQALRSLEPRVRIVAMSGQAPEDAAKAVVGGLKAKLAKPFTAAELLQAVARALA
jgi:CheY-like chemotaxis protein